MKILSFVSALILLIPLASLSQDAPMFRGDLQHTGVYNSAGFAKLDGVKWKFHTSGRVISSPAVVKGVVYAGSTDCNLYAIDADTGNLKWKFETKGWVVSSPAVDSGTVYFESYDSNFYAVDASSGQLKWKFQTGGERHYTGKHLHYLQPAAESMPDPWDVYLSSPSVWKGAVYFGSGDGNVYALDANSGALKWKFQTGDVVHSSPAIADGVLYIGSWDTYLYALDATSGKEKWRFKTADDPEAHNHVGIQSSPAVVGGVVYFGSRDAYSYAVDAATGKQNWRFSTEGSWVNNSPVVHDGTVYFGTSIPGIMHAVEAKTGKAVFDVLTGAPIFASMALAPGMLYVGTFGGKLMAIDLKTQKPAGVFETDGEKQNGASMTNADGSIKFETLFPGPNLFYEDMVLAVHKIFTMGSILSSPVIVGGTLFFGSSDGNVYALTGAVTAQERPAPVSYDLALVIQPKHGSIQVHGKIGVPVAAEAKTLTFGLHETFGVKKLLVNDHPATFSFQPGQASMLNPATRNVVVTLPAQTGPGKIQLEIEYGGQLKQLPEFGTFADRRPAMDDQINSRMVELANYSSWYPQFFATGHAIESSLEVSLPKGWTAVCSGKKLEEHEKEGRSITRWSSPQDIDILVAAAPNYKKRLVSLPDGQVEIYYTNLPEDFVDKEGGEIGAVMSLFSQGLGDSAFPSATVKHVFSPKHRGQGRAGIARPGMIVTSEGIVLEELAKDPNFSLFQDVAHEMAHFWWNFGAGQGDWINEAFSEYSSAIAVRQVVSAEQFDSVIQGYRNAVRELPEDAPSLAKVPFDGSGFVVRYYKGSLMLDAVRQALGDDHFYQAAREFYETYKGKSAGTEEFRSFWKEKLGEQKALVDLWLDTGGSLPDTERKTSASAN